MLQKKKRAVLVHGVTDRQELHSYLHEHARGQRLLDVGVVIPRSELGRHHTKIQPVHQPPELFPHVFRRRHRPFRTGMKNQQKQDTQK